jgi:hypothetical protein
VSQWLRRGFGLLVGFIGCLQVVTTINYYPSVDFHTTKHSTLISSVYLHYSSRIYNTGTMKISLNHTIPIPLYYSTHKVFKSQVKSSQADLLFSSSTTNFSWLSLTKNWLVPEPNEFCHFHCRGTDTSSQETQVTWPPPTAAWLHRGHGKHSLLYCCMLDRVYKAVASQRVDEIHYNIAHITLQGSTYFVRESGSPVQEFDITDKFGVSDVISTYEPECMRQKWGQILCIFCTCVSLGWILKLFVLASQII